jgi:hypothetical protein
MEYSHLGMDCAAWSLVNIEKVFKRSPGSDFIIHLLFVEIKCLPNL